MGRLISWICWKLKWGWYPKHTLDSPFSDSIFTLWVHRRTGKKIGSWKRRRHAS